jgi:hypothetical protein
VFIGRNIGKQLKRLPEFEQTLLGPHFCRWIVVVFRMANGSNKIASLFKQVSIVASGNGLPVAIYGNSSH